MGRDNRGFGIRFYPEVESVNVFLDGHQCLPPGPHRSSQVPQVNPIQQFSCGLNLQSSLEALSSTCMESLPSEVGPPWPSCKTCPRRRRQTVSFPSSLQLRCTEHCGVPVEYSAFAISLRASLTSYPSLTSPYKLFRAREHENLCKH